MSMALRSAYLFPTGRCNLTCQGCFATLEEYGRHSKRGELSTEEYQKVIDACVELGVTHFDISGGEPFLRLDLVEICRAIKAHEGMTLALVNNGTLAKPETLAKLAPLVDSLNVSLDAADPALHDDIRGKKGAFRNGMETLRRAKALGFASVGVNFLLMDRNLDQVEGMFDLCREERLDRLAVLTFRDVSENDVQYDNIPAMTELTDLWSSCAELLDKGPSPAVLEMVAPPFLYPEASRFQRGLPSELRQRFRFHFPNLRGYAPFNTMLVVKPQGSLTGDTSMINDAEFDLGPARLGLSEVWQAGSETWRRRLKEREDELRKEGPCASCSRWHYCRGGCAAAALNQWGDWRRYDRSCDKFRQQNAF